MNTKSYLEQIRAQTATHSDYSIAKTLGISTSSVVNYMKHGKPMGDRIAIEAGEAIGKSPEVAMLEIQLERAKDEKVIKTIKSILAKLSGTAASVALAFGMLGNPAPAMAGGYSGKDFNPVFSASFEPNNNDYAQLLEWAQKVISRTATICRWLFL